LVIPFRALRRDLEGEYVFAVDADNKISRIAVRSGLRIGEQVEILEGIEPGTNVVIKGFLGLTPGKPVKIVSPDSSRATAG
jgi:hypothetical protein